MSGLKFKIGIPDLALATGGFSSYFPGILYFLLLDNFLGKCQAAVNNKLA